MALDKSALSDLADALRSVDRMDLVKEHVHVSSLPGSFSDGPLRVPGLAPSTPRYDLDGRGGHRRHRCPPPSAAVFSYVATAWPSSGPWRAGA